METIAVDIDDVISSLIESFIKYYNEKYNTNLIIDDFMHPGEYWGFYENALTRILGDGVSIQEYRRRFVEYLDTDTHISGQYIHDSARKTIAELKKHYNLQVITARDKCNEEETTRWLNKEFPDTFSAVHFNTTWKDTNAYKTKAEICQHIGASYIIDDSVEHCNESAARGIKAVLFGRYGWNSYHNVHKDVIRLTDWDEVYSYFMPEKS